MLWRGVFSLLFAAALGMREVFHMLPVREVTRPVATGACKHGTSHTRVHLVCGRFTYDSLMQQLLAVPLEGSPHVFIPIAHRAWLPAVYRCTVWHAMQHGYLQAPVLQNLGLSQLLMCHFLSWSLPWMEPCCAG